MLGSLGTYYMSYFRMYGFVNKFLKNIRASFFLGGNVGEIKMHWVR